MSTTAVGRSTVSRIRSMRVVPPAMYLAPDLAAANAARSSAALLKVNGNTSASPAARGLRDRGDDVGVGATAADVAAHPLSDLRRRTRVLLVDTPDAGDDLTRRAVSALEGVLVDEGLLEWVQPAVLGEAFDGGDLGAVVHDRQGQAGVHPPAVEQNRART